MNTKIYSKYGNIIVVGKTDWKLAKIKQSPKGLTKGLAIVKYNY